jgi:hypothetical protein
MPSAKEKPRNKHTPAITLVLAPHLSFIVSPYMLIAPNGGLQRSSIQLFNTEREP